MSVFDIFKSAPAQQPAPATQATPGNIPPQSADPAAPGNPTLPATDPSANPAQTQATDPATPDSPLDQFKDLWHTEPNKDAGTPEPIVPTLATEDVQKALANHNFTQGITPEQLAAISAGGEEAQAAFIQAMNATAKQVMTSSTLVSNKLVEQAVTRALEQQAAKVPDMLRSQAASNHLQDSNPIFSNPAVKPIMEATQAQLMQKFPTATPAELTKMTNDYITAMGEAFSPKPATDTSVINATDWEKFLSN